MHVLGRSVAALCGAVLMTAALLTVVPLAGSFADLGAAQAAAPGARVERAAPGEVYPRAAYRATNRQRAEEDLRRLRQNRCLQRFANRQARAMARQQEMYHQELEPVLSACRLSYVGENVATGYPSGRAVVQAWMASPGHRENILRPEFKLMAIGAEKGDDGRWYAAQVFGRR